MNGKEVKKVFIKGVKTIGKPIIVIAVIGLLVAALFYGVIDGIFKNTAKIFNDVAEHVKISGNNLEIDQDYLSEAKKRLDRMGINPTTLGLDGHEDYLERFLEAEIVTSYPYLGGDGLQGAVYFERYKIDEEVQQLEYIDKDTFYAKKDKGEDIYNYFTIDQDDWTAHVMTIDGDIEKINYKNMVSKYAMPFEFPITLASVSQNPQFAMAVVNLVKRSKIVIAITESKTTITTTNTMRYQETVVTQDTTGNGGNQTAGDGTREVTLNPQVSVEEIYSTDIYLARANTWILNEITNMKYEDVTNEDEPQVTHFQTEEFQQNLGNGVVRTITRSNKTETKEVERHYQRWVRGTSEIIEKSKNFTNLILRDDGFSGGGLVAIAKELHDYLANNQYWYPSKANLAAGGYVKDGQSQKHKFPEEGEPPAQRYVDCSAYISWVLQRAGYNMGLKTAKEIGQWGKDKGWEEINNIGDVQAGDICIWNAGGHVNICVGENENHQKIYYDCGWTGAIRSVEPIVYGDQGFFYAVRPNDEIAQQLNAKNAEALKDQIKKYLDNVNYAKIGVTVQDLSSASKFNINNLKTPSNGWIKLFIMATAYDEINKGHIQEKEISAEIERMITTDDNGAANSILRKLGKDDIEKGTNLVNAHIRKYGYGKTKICKEGILDNNEESKDTYTRTEDVTKLMKKIFDGKCVNKEFSEKMLELLKGQLKTDLISSQIDNGIVANKTGNQGKVVQDTAIVSLEKANYIISISASEISNFTAVENDIKVIAKLVNKYFTENGKLINNDNYYQELDGIETIMNGRRVCYKLNRGVYQCPLDNLVKGRGMLFDLLGSSEKTQMHEKLMRYLLYLLTGRNFGVTEFDFNEFLNGSFNNISGIYGNTPQEKVWWALIGAGYSKEAAAGVLGNIEAESGFNQAAIEGGNGIGFGLCQWSFGRRTQLENYAASKGVSPSDLNTQIEFLLGELTPGGGANGYATYQLVTYNGYSGDSWRNATTPENAAIAFCWSFERPGIPRMEVRTAAARKYYEQFKNAKRPIGGGSVTSIQAVLPNYPFSSSSGFGWRTHPIYGDRRFHQGTDIPAPTGTEIAALGGGIIKEMQWAEGRGYYVRIDHQNGLETVYQHCSGFAPGLSAGSKVAQGQIIAYVGSTGWSTGPHLHLEILVPAGQGEHSSYFSGFDVVNPETFDYTRFPG